jgi:hypothetical protein
MQEAEEKEGRSADGFLTRQAQDTWDIYIYIGVN